MNLQKYKKLWIVLLLIVILSASAVFYFRSTLFFQGVTKPKHGDVVESIYGLGTVTTDQIFRVRAGANLTVQKVFVKEGDSVKVGQSLIQLDENIMRSLIEGTVTSVAYKYGELVPPQISVVTVTNLEKLFLEVSLEQQSVLRIKKNQKVFVSFESIREEKYEGSVASVYPRDNQFIVRIELQKWPKGLLPGMTADAAILVGEKSNVMLIPLRSIVAGQVIRVRNNKKERIPVKLGIISGEWAEVTSDNIQEDDELITRK